MTKDEIISAVKKLDLPEGEFIVFGSCPMAAAGIRESSDIDLLVTSKVLKDLEQAGWKRLVKAENDAPLTFGDFEAHDQWSFTSYKPTLSQLLATADIIDGVPFASLAEVRKWKQSSGRPKDLKDIELIDSYVTKSK